MIRRLDTEQIIGTHELAQRLGVTRQANAPDPIEVVQTPNRVVILYESWHIFRSIPTDGRDHPKNLDPTWFGNSVGKWDGDTLVVETTGFNDRGWLDARGHTHSEALRLTERFHRPDFGHMEVQLTIDDPRTYTRPFTIRIKQRLLPDTDLLESYCAENEKDSHHLEGK